MAGTDQGGAAIPSSFQPTNYSRAYFIGLSYGYGYGVPTNVNQGWDAYRLDLDDLAGARTNTDRESIAKPAPTDQGEASPSTDSDKTNSGLDWFEKIHAIPRTKIEFGFILTQETEEYEIYNAYRRTDHTLNSTSDDVTPGVTLPSLSTPALVPAQSSVLDPTTTDNTGDTEVLGTLVQLQVVAAQDGLPVFDGSVLFTFVAPANSPSIFLSGQRLVLMPMEFESPVTEYLEFLTDVLTSTNGKEQRISLREQPRQLFELIYRLLEDDRQRMQALIMDWTDNTFGLPLWHEHVRLTSSVSSGTYTYPVKGADDVDFRAGGYAVIIDDSNTYDVINISSVTDTLITANDPSVNGYSARTRIMPLRLVNVLKQVSGNRHKNTLEDFKVLFEVTDNTTGALTGDDTPGWWSTYGGKVLFDDGNFVRDMMSQQFIRRVHRTDNLTGKTSLSSDWGQGRRSGSKGFVARNRAQILQLRKLLIDIRGKAKSFYVPTFIDDLTLAAGLTNGTDTMLIERIEYTRLVQNRNPKATFKITFTDDSSLVRTITASEIYSGDSTVEQLTLDTTWPADRTVDEVERIEFYEEVRFDTDRFKIVYPRIGLATMMAPVKTLIDV